MIGNEIHNFAKQLWPINRSLTGEGVRETLAKIKKIIPELKIQSIRSGTKVFDWEIPREWHVYEAYILTPRGEKICDFSKNNLHLIGYSAPFKGEMNLDQLKEHLYFLNSQPNAVPYVTSYYEERWGFCLTKNQFDTLEKGIYKVFINSKFFKGEMNYGEILIPGLEKKEIFLSSYICHPSMANNELSGPTVLTFLSKWIKEKKKRRYTYRIIFIPETIGSISYLSINYKEMRKNIIAGYNVTCVGDDRTFSYIPSRKGETLSDNVAKHVLKWIDKNYISYSWLDRGSDERQYCAPFIDLPIASIIRTKFGEYPEYHTSLDDLKNVVTPSGLEGGYNAIKRALELIENNFYYKVTTLGEPQMGRRGLYPTLSTKESNISIKLMMDLISLCDGETSLLQIAEILNVPAWELYELIGKLLKNKLISF